MARTLDLFLFGGALALLVGGCRNEPLPKPRGYFRIDLPEERYLPYRGSCPFTGDVPAYAVMTRDVADSSRTADTTCWVEMRFPMQKANVYMTYRRVRNDLPELIADAHAFKSKHEVKAARIRSERLLHPEHHVFGNFFSVDGDVASPAVFYLTDSTRNFLYGALYFDARPNADSLAPVTARIRRDLQHFAATLNWQ